MSLLEEIYCPYCCHSLEEIDCPTHSCPDSPPHKITLADIKTAKEESKKIISQDKESENFIFALDIEGNIRIHQYISETQEEVSETQEEVSETQEEIVVIPDFVYGFTAHCFLHSVTGRISYNSKEGTFSQGNRIKEIKLGKGLVDLSYMLQAFQQETIDISQWDVRKIKNFSNLFIFSKIKSVDLSQWDMSKTENFTNFFRKTRMEQVGDLSQWDVSSGKSFRGMFIKSDMKYVGDLSQWDVSSGENFEEMFFDSKLQDVGDLSQWDVSSGEIFEKMFFDSKLKDVGDLSQWDVSSGQIFEGMFWNSQLTHVGDLLKWDVSKGTRFKGMFRNSRIESVDLSLWDLTNATTISGMFQLSSLVSVGDLSRWNTENVVKMASVFQQTRRMTKVEGIGKWNLSKVEKLTMFFKHSSLTDVGDLSQWDTSQVSDFSYLFFQTRFTEVGNIGEWKGEQHWDTSNGKDFSNMFFNSRLVNVGDLSQWNMGKAEDLTNMFHTSQLRNVGDLGNWKTDNVVSMSCMFCNSKLESVGDLSPWNTEKTKDFSALFYNSILEDVGKIGKWEGKNHWDTTNGEDFSSMFYRSKIKDVGDLSHWVTEQAKNLREMFRESALESVGDLSYWDTKNVTDFYFLFAVCPLSDVGKIGRWDTSKGEIFTSMFYKSDLTDVGDLSGWVTENAKELTSMFYKSNLKYVGDLSNWKTKNVSHFNFLFSFSQFEDIGTLENWDVSYGNQMKGMFSACNLKTSLDLSRWNVSNVHDMSEMFRGAAHLTSVGNLSNWKVSSVLSFDRMFQRTPYLNERNTGKLRREWKNIDSHATEINLGSHYFKNLIRRRPQIITMSIFSHVKLHEHLVTRKNNQQENEQTMMIDISKELESLLQELALRKALTSNRDADYLTGELTEEEIQTDNQSFFNSFAKGYQQYMQAVKEQSDNNGECTTIKNQFLFFFAAFVNLYFLTGMHLVYPNQSTTKWKERLERKEDASVSLEKNKNFFLEQIKNILQNDPLFPELENLFHGIFTQDMNKFQEIQKNNPSSLVSHYLFYCNVELYFQELNQPLEPENMDAQEASDKLKEIQNLLSLNYDQYEKEGHFPPIYNENQAKEYLCDSFPIPYFRYNAVAINTLSNSRKIISDLNRRVYVNKKTKEDLKHMFSSEVLKKNIADLKDLQEDKEVGTWKLANKKDFASIESLERNGRAQFLKLPYYVDMKQSTFHILLDSFLTQYQLEEQKNLLEEQKNLLEEQKNLLLQQQAQREKLFEEQSHNWKHSSYPDIAFQVAKSLQSRGVEEDLFLSQKLNFVYVANNQLLNNINLLRMEYGTSADSFLPTFREGVFKATYLEDEAKGKILIGERFSPDGKSEIVKQPVNIREILVHAFQLLAYRLFLPESDPSVNARKMRDSVINSTALSHLTQSFYDEFLIGTLKESQLIPWFSYEGYEITWSTSPLWDELVFAKKKPCYTVLMDFLMNLLLNAVNYGAKSKDGHLSIAFSQEEKDGVAYLCIVFENKLDQSPSIEDSEGKGLQGIENRLQRMNLQKKMPRYVLTSTPEKDIFRTELWMELNAFWIEKEKNE